jgi:predicted P-loop ATPase
MDGRRQRRRWRRSGAARRPQGDHLAEWLSVRVRVPEPADGEQPLPKPDGEDEPPPPLPPPPPPVPHWKDFLQRSEKGKGPPVANLANAALALRRAPELRGIVSFDEMLQHAMLLRTVPACRMEPVTAPRPLRDTDVNAVQEWLQWQGLRRIGKDIVHQAIDLVSREHAFHPVRDYLLGLQWDGTPRIHKWLAYYLGAEPDEKDDEAEKARKRAYLAKIGRWFLISMVARIMRPGCKCDYMMVLEGDQGIMKSSVCRILAGEWFSDSLPDLHGGDKVRLSMHLRGKWLIEIAEMASLSKAEAGDLKSFITQQEERYTPKYARQEVIEPRQCCYVGSTNRGEYLRDETGGRRFWPVKCGTIALVDLKRDRDQLFAEAMVAFQADEKWWPDQDFEREHIKPEQDARFEGDAWDDKVEEWTRSKATCTTADVAVHALFIDVGRITSADQRRIAVILTRLGWQSRRSGKRCWWAR